jgi:hypothetical protein
MFDYFRITDIFGTEILNGKLEEPKTMIKIQSSGIYFLYMSGGKQCFNIKIIVVDY